MIQDQMSRSEPRFARLTRAYGLAKIKVSWLTRWLVKHAELLAELELVAASVRRVEETRETILASDATRELGYFAEERRVDYDHLADVSPPNILLLELMKRERALDKYLKQANYHPLMAFACAKGDIAHLEQLRAHGWVQSSPRSVRNRLVIPTLLVILTAVLGNWVGTTLQANSLEKTRTFEVNLERLREGQRIASALLVSLRDIHTSIQRDEERNELYWRPHVTLRPLANELELIRSVAAGLDSRGAIGDALVRSNSQLESYIGCLENRTEGEMCSADFQLGSFLDLQDELSLALIAYLEASENSVLERTLKSWF